MTIGNLMASQQNQELLQKTEIIRIVGILKGLVPRSFEKTFDGVAETEIVSAMKVCVEDLSYQQVKIGLDMVRDNGFCPDPAMFRKWCLGVTGFGNEQQRLSDRYVGKNGALVNIQRWLNSDRQTRITTAEFEAYSRCAEAFNDINFSKNVDYASRLAYEAFKDNYVQVVAEMVEQGLEPVVYVAPPEIAQKSQQEEQYREVCKGIPSDLRKQLFKAVEQDRTVEEMADEQRVNRAKTLEHFQKLGEVA